MRSVLTILVVAVFGVGCGGGGVTTPATNNSASVAGSWSGVIQYSAGLSNTPILQTIVMNLTQSGSTVTGTYTTPNFSGTVTGTTTTSVFSGSFTFNSTSVTGTACTGTFAVTGNAGGTMLNWTSPGVTANCSGTPQSIVIGAAK